MKTCPVCEEIKPFDAFYKHSGLSDGMTRRCKSCSKKASQIGNAVGQVLKQWVSASSPTECWEWTIKVDQKTGYGQKTWGNRTVLAHRWMYEVFNGPIPSELVIDHLCRNRKCVNPWHLEPVTQSTNVSRGRGAKITLEQREQIKSRRRAGEDPGLIAREYGISYHYARQLRN